MLFQIVMQHPEALPTIISRTPVWVGGLLVGLVLLGLSQVKTRQASLTRLLITPTVMTILALYSMVSAFGANGQLTGVLSMWTVATGATLLLLARLPVPRGTRYDLQRKQFHLAGSWVPLVMILGIFLTKYIVGIETAMDPSLSRDPVFALTVSGLYGAFSGVFIARTLRLVRMALSHKNSAALPAV